MGHVSIISLLRVCKRVIKIVKIEMFRRWGMDKKYLNVYSLNNCQLVDDWESDT